MPSVGGYADHSSRHDTLKVHIGSSWSNRLSGLQAIDHEPDTICFAALDDLQWCGIFKCRICSFEPVCDAASLHDP